MFSWWVVILLVILVIALALGWGGSLGLHRDNTLQQRNATPSIPR